MEFNSARTYARIEDNLVEAEKWGVIALDMEPDNSQVPWFLANEVYRPQKKMDKVAEMFKLALDRADANLERPFKSGGVEITTVHQAIKNEASTIHNDGIKLLNRGKKNKAMSKFLFSMELNPTLVENYIALSDMSYDRGDMDKTMQYLDKGFSINPTNQNLIFRKSKYARESKNYDLAISSLQQIKTDDEKLNLLVEKEIFMIYIDKEDYNQAIEFGSQLFDKLYENTDTEDLVLSETCYNLAVCYRYIGYELYNNVADVIQSATDDKELIKKTLDDAESAKEYLSIAKEKFFDASGFNPDDKTSSNYAKELSKVIKQLRKLFIPALEEKL
jgi:tetratricopeptide (TPR) repeat protein